MSLCELLLSPQVGCQPAQRIVTERDGGAGGVRHVSQVADMVVAVGRYFPDPMSNDMLRWLTVCLSIEANLDPMSNDGSAEKVPSFLNLRTAVGTWNRRPQTHANTRQW